MSAEKLFRATAPFMGVPQTTDLSGAKAAIVGMPFDCGVNPVRIGSRLGPASIREQSALLRPYCPPGNDYDAMAALGLVDCGDADVIPSQIEESFAAMEGAVRHVVDAGAIPVTMGGDGAVTLPQLRALRDAYPDLALLHIDAHTDAYPLPGYNNATTFTRATEEGVLDLAHSIHVGPRGPTDPSGVFEFTRQVGYELIDGSELAERGIAEITGYLRSRLENRPIYLCFDMDFFDPSVAPGVCTPVWGGATAREGLALLSGLSGLNFVAFDVNTVSPPHDTAGMTAFLAGRVMLECLYLACAALDLVPSPEP